MNRLAAALRAVTAVALCMVTTAAPVASGSSGSVPVFGAVTQTVRLAIDGGINHVAAVDLNGDGHPDVLLTVEKGTGNETRPVRILLNDGRGNLSDQTPFVFSGPVPKTAGPSQLVIADFNGDGRPDVFIADGGNDAPPYSGFQNTLILSAPGGRIADASANLPQVSDNSGSACAADVNHDGHPDIYVGNLYSAGLVPPRLLINDGTGHFSVGGSLPPELTDPSFPVRYTSCAFVDVNGDGSPDLVLGADDHTPESAVLLNDGSGNFDYVANALPAKPFGSNAIALAIASADVNHDGHADLLLAYTRGDPFYTDSSIQVLVNNGDGTFRDETATRLANPDGASPIYGLEVLDLDHNGTPDFGTLLGAYDNASPDFFTSNSNGVFHPVVPTLGVGGWALVDLNGDGRLDLVQAAGLGGGNVYVTLQEAPPKTLPKCRGGHKPTKRHPCSTTE